MRFEEMEFNKEEAIDRIMSDFDVDHSGNLSYEEFYRGISKWISEARHIAAMPANHSTNFIEEYHQVTYHHHSGYVFCFNLMNKMLRFVTIILLIKKYNAIINI